MCRYHQRRRGWQIALKMDSCFLKAWSGKNGIPFKAVKIESRETAQNAPTPITTYALFCDGEYVTNEQMNDKKFLKLVNG
ncbi:hypothetical protein BXO88_14735 [Oribacterium sp. C9]|nr:hypothetical protein BXO88_14735 [Oribacterium sp. C9]